MADAKPLVRERAGRRNITLRPSVDQRLGEVRADERKIKQVVLNLLSNAIKFTPEGGPDRVAALPKDGSVEVSVSDTGIGIAPTDQEAVFQEFRQVVARRKYMGHEPAVRGFDVHVHLAVARGRTTSRVKSE